MSEKSKISAGQLMLILLLGRIMHTMIFRARDFTTGTPMMLGLLLSTVIEAVAALPAVIYFSRGGTDPADEIGGRFAFWVRAAYSVYFIAIGGATAALFTGFMGAEFPGIVNPYVIIALLCGAAAYCALRGGIEGLARAATVVFWLFAVLFAVMAAVNEGGFEWLNLRPMLTEDVPRFKKYFIESLSSSWWLPMLCALGRHLKSGAAKAAYGYLALKFAIIEALLLLMTLVLWRYVDVLGYPIFALGAYAKSGFIQRFDAINMLVWAINCVTVVGVYVFIGASPSDSPKKGALTAAVVAGVSAAIAYKTGLRFDETWFLWFKSIGVVLLGIVVPTAAAIVFEIKRRRRLWA